MQNQAGEYVSAPTKNRPAFRLKILSVYLMLSFGSNGYALPSGGSVTSGSASISNNANKTTISQSTQNAAINWQSFSIGQSETVQFIQPNASSVVLNRVIGSDPSSILGNMIANGKVFLVNPNGILFGKGAQVNVAGLVASTLNITDRDFMAGSYSFSGADNGTVVNLGSISTNGDGQYVALLGAKVGNDGFISAKIGTITLAAGTGITLDVVGDGLLNVTVNKGAVNAIVQNSGLIRADGGLVLMTAQAAGNLLTTVVNNTGQVQAQTIENHNGTIKMLADMQSGTVNIGGVLNASAPNGGNGGFIETSAAHVQIANNARITTFANKGMTGTWLIDPLDFTVATTGGDITGATLSNMLVSNSVVISTVVGTNTLTSLYATTPGNGDIFVNDAVSWIATPVPTTLTLNAGRDVNVNSSITGTNGSLAMNAGRDININTPAAITTTDGGLSLEASNNVNINHAAITTTRGNVVLMAGIGGTGTGSVVFAAGNPLFTVTGPGAAIKIYNPISTTTDYSGNFALSSGATLAQYSLVFAVGLQGPAGSVGPIGLTGATGLSGLMGPIGLTGATGASGMNGINGIDGATGLTGSIGPIGLTGATGAPGANGINGIDGAIGLTGPTGPIGLTGPTGATGLTGSIGPIGLTGFTGTPGANGSNGIDGAIGLTGPTGPIGLTGATGATGLTGSVGPIGATGVTGAPGANGSNGTDGIAGLTGPIGPIGLTGSTGATGLTGSVGPIGATGATGATGTNGSNGIDGTAGLTGPIGPIGLTGATGATGLTGSIGPIGLTGATGATGLTGPIGQMGLTGTIGATGLTGAIGPIGLTGATGLTGSIGPIGLTGATGAPGTNGVDGIPGGPIGPIGLTGATGATGLTGPIGPIGLTGATGATGLTGPMGQAGLASSTVLYPGPASVLSARQDYLPLSKSLTPTTPASAAADFELNWYPAKQLIAMTDQSYEHQRSKKSVSNKYNTWHGSNQVKTDAKLVSSPSAKAVSAALALADTDAAPAKGLTKEDLLFVSLNIVGNPMDGSKFAKLKIGMTIKQVEELIGAPDWTWQQFTGAESTPYYTGTDPWLVQYTYRSEGMLTFNLSQERVLIRMLVNRAG